MESLENEASKKISLINREIEEDAKSYHEVVESFFDYLPKESALKSIEQQIKEKEELIRAFEKSGQEALKIGISCFISKATVEEKPRVGKILNKVGSIMNEMIGIGKADYVSNEDCKFLEDIAKRQLIDGQHFESSCMYRLIALMDVTCGEAWVGWAISEQELGNKELVDFIYQFALTLMPDHHYIALFAADFYTSVDQKDKAIAILENSKKQLEENHQEQSVTFENVQQSLMALAH